MSKLPVDDVSKAVVPPIVVCKYCGVEITRYRGVWIDDTIVFAHYCASMKQRHEPDLD